MATDQGKTANLNGLAILAEVTGRPIAEVGITTFRPPFTPVAIGAFAGHHTRQGLSADAADAVARWSPRSRARSSSRPAPGCGRSGIPAPARPTGSPRSTARWRRCASGVGVCDVSTLGKIDVQGSDAGIFLDRVYANTFSTLPVGKARYGLMLREDGFVLDDGTTARLGEDHYFMTTTTANALRVMQHLEFCHQCIWPELDVQMVSVTEQWAQFSVAGPRARDVLAAIVDGDISNEAFPYLAAGASHRLRRRPGAALPPLLLGRARLRDFGAGALWRCADPRDHGGRRAARHRRLRHRGARRACASRRAISPATS